MYYITYDLVINESRYSADYRPEYSNCSVTIDAATGLITEYTWSMQYESHFSSEPELIEVSNTGTVEYNVDAKPDYSLKF